MQADQSRETGERKAPQSVIDVNINSLKLVMQVTFTSALHRIAVSHLHACEH